MKIKASKNNRKLKRLTDSFRRLYWKLRQAESKVSDMLFDDAMFFDELICDLYAEDEDAKAEALANKRRALVQKADAVADRIAKKLDRLSLRLPAAVCQKIAKDYLAELEARVRRLDEKLTQKGLMVSYSNGSEMVFCSLEYRRRWEAEHPGVIALILPNSPSR